MSIRFFIIAAVSAFLAACSCGGDDSKNVDFSKINTFVVSDSSGYEVGKGRAYAVINIAEPSGLSKLCKKNYAMWVSTVLQVDPTDDKNAVQSLATAFAQKEALRNQAYFIDNQNELEDRYISEIYTRVGIRKLYEDQQYITFMKEDTVVRGEVHKSHLAVGFTFNKEDFALADLLNTDDVKSYRKKITDQLQKSMGMSHDQLLDYLFLGDDCKKEGVVPLPANGPFLLADSLVFLYQEYEIAPYKAGMPCVKLPFKRKKQVAKTGTAEKSANSDAKNAKTDSGKKSVKSEKKKTDSAKKQSKKDKKSAGSEKKKTKSADSPKKKSNTDKKPSKADKKRLSRTRNQRNPRNLTRNRQKNSILFFCYNYFL